MRLLLKKRLSCDLYAAAILALSLMPASAMEGSPKLLPHQDKIVHVGLYAGLAWLMARAWDQALQRRPWKTIGIIVIGATAYGGLLEMLQGFVPAWQRGCSACDMLANLLGAALGMVPFLMAARRRGAA